MGMNASAVNLYTTAVQSGTLTNPRFDQWFSVWKMSRVIKSAGWTYKASTTGTGGTSDTTGNPLLDKWGPGGIVSGHILFDSQSGSGAIVNTVSRNTVNITGLSGMTSSSVGHALTLSGATNTGNNGTFTIVNFVSATSVDIHNANPGVVEGTSLTWSERISGSASITWSSVSAGIEQTISGLSGMTTSSAGHFIYLTGSASANNNGTFAILKFISSSSVVIINSAGVSDTASGNWTELDPLLDVYPPTTTQLNTGSWAVYQGPSSLKIPINSVSTGTFVNGENITQSGSSAQGELIGYQYDTASAQGYLVVMPRQNGSGTGVLGWSTASSTITGGTSGATVTTANGSTPIEYVREAVFWQQGMINGLIYYCVVDGYAESASRFTSLFGASTVSVAPGGGAAGNLFPPSAGAFVVKGSASTSTSSQPWFTGSTFALGRTSIFAANASYTANTSADGTWTIVVGWPSGTLITVGNPWAAFVGMGFWRLDNTEPGDVDPYVWFMPSANTVYNENRVGIAGATTTQTTEQFSLSTISTNTWLKGTRRRGFTLGDGMQPFQMGILGATGGGFSPLIYTPDQEPDGVATSLASFPPRAKDPLWILSTQTTSTVANQTFGRIRKGTLRWGYVLAGFSGTQSFENRMFVQLSNHLGKVSLGPWDGVSPLYQT